MVNVPTVYTTIRVSIPALLTRPFLLRKNAITHTPSPRDSAIASIGSVLRMACGNRASTSSITISMKVPASLPCCTLSRCVRFVVPGGLKFCSQFLLPGTLILLCFMRNMLPSFRGCLEVIVSRRY